MELLSAMMKQVSLLDMTVRSQTKEIKLKVMLDPSSKHELLHMLITDMFCLQDKKITALEKKLQPQCESGEPPQT